MKRRQAASSKQQATSHRRSIAFTKVVGAGNDFVLVDNRTARLRQLPQLARQMCDRRYGVGGDGLLLLDRSTRADVRMRIFNPDGSEPSMCGNGARCFARYAFEQHVAPCRMRIETRSGVLAARVDRRTVQCDMPAPPPPTAHALRLGRRTWRVYMTSAGVPHVVVLVPAVDRIDVAGIGRQLRYHRRFAPQGANVNFVEVGRRGARLRTYERGVEGETLACGSGATAGAAVLWYTGRARSPVTLVTRSGERLRVHLTALDGRVAHAVLEGPARIVYTGRWERSTGDGA